MNISKYSNLNHILVVGVRLKIKSQMTVRYSKPLTYIVIATIHSSLSIEYSEALWQLIVLYLEFDT